MGHRPTIEEALSTSAVPYIGPYGHTHWGFSCPKCNTEQDSVDTEEEPEVECGYCEVVYYPVYPS